MSLSDDIAAITKTELRRWNAEAPLGTPTFVTYSFPGAPSARDGWKGLSPLGEQHQGFARQALDTWAAAAGIRFLEVPEAAGGQIRFSFADFTGRLNSEGAQASGWAYQPTIRTELHGGVPTQSAAMFDIGGDVFLNAQMYQTNAAAMAPGQRGYSILLHEIGHALGFKHPFEGDPTIEPAHDNGDYTIMSYDRPRTTTALGPVDVAAMQLFYGTRQVAFSWDAASLALVVNGTAGSDALLGTELHDTLNGGDGSDLLVGAMGNDRLNGGAGLDTASYSGPQRDYAVSRNGEAMTVSAAAAARGGVDALTGVERLRFADGVLAFDADGHAGQAYRLYQAAFDRTPDRTGVSFWTRSLDDGSALRTVAQGFVESAEFKAVYGASPSSAQIVDLFYRNVLGRSGEPDGTAYWVGALNRGTSAADVLVGFAESQENRAAVAPALAGGLSLSLEFFV